MKIKQINLKVDEELYKHVCYFTEMKGITISEYLRNLIVDDLNGLNEIKRNGNLES
jgi:negative regulator of replication initiation